MQTQYTIVVLLLGFRQEKRRNLKVFHLSFYHQLHPYLTEVTKILIRHYISVAPLHTCRAVAGHGFFQTTSQQPLSGRDRPLAGHISGSRLCHLYIMTHCWARDEYFGRLRPCKVLPLYRGYGLLVRVFSFNVLETAIMGEEHWWGGHENPNDEEPLAVWMTLKTRQQWRAVLYH